MEHDKYAVRCRVEHSFIIVKRHMGCAKVVYRGIEKNMHRFNFLFANASLPCAAGLAEPGNFKGAWLSMPILRASRIQTNIREYGSR